MSDDAPQIGIVEVLSTIRSATDLSRPFRLTIVVSTGRSAGSIRVLAQCVKGAPSGSPASGTGGAADRSRVLHKERDTLPIHDLEDGQYKTIPISHIIGFNEYRVKH